MDIRILLVDNDPSMLPAVRSVLNLPHWHVESTENSQSATELLTAQTFHLVIAGDELPGMNSRDLAEHIGSNHPQIPVVILTTIDVDPIYLPSGAAHQVSKPNLQRDLVGVVVRLLDEAAGASNHSESDDDDKDQEEETPPASDDHPSAGNHAELAQDYEIRKWGDSLRRATADLGAETKFTPEKLLVLRRQAERLEKWGESEAKKASRKYDRRYFGDVVFILPLDESGQPIFAQRFISFCRNISPGGCALLHSRLIPFKQIVIFFPHLGDGMNRCASLESAIVRDRPLSIGMYEIGVRFVKLVRLPQEDEVVLTAAAREHAPTK